VKDVDDKAKKVKELVDKIPGKGSFFWWKKMKSFYFLFIKIIILLIPDTHIYDLINILNENSDSFVSDHRIRIYIFTCWEIA
jgi:hypothetical protein